MKVVTTLPQNDPTYPVCSHCLADSRFTGRSKNSGRVCPECSADYSGEARTEEFNVLVAAGLIVPDPV